MPALCRALCRGAHSLPALFPRPRLCSAAAGTSTAVLALVPCWDAALGPALAQSRVAALLPQLPCSWSRSNNPQQWLWAVRAGTSLWLCPHGEEHGWLPLQPGPGSLVLPISSVPCPAGAWGQCLGPSARPQLLVAKGWGRGYGCTALVSSEINRPSGSTRGPSCPCWPRPGPGVPASPLSCGLGRMLCPSLLGQA